MKNLKIFFLLFLNCSIGFAFKEIVNTKAYKLATEKTIADSTSYQHFFPHTGSSFSKNIGQPQLPAKSYLFVGEPQTISINVKTILQKQIDGVKLAPTLPEKCRCSVDKKAFSFNASLYEAEQAMIKKTYLGKLRGQPITKVDINLVDYNAKKMQMKLFEKVVISSNAQLFAYDIDVNKNMLVVVPKMWEESVSEFVKFKTAQGFNVTVETVSAPENTTALLQEKIKLNFQNTQMSFAIIVGDENVIPMFSVETSSSLKTPSDINYFKMDGESDTLPDVFSSRIVATTATGAKLQLQKIIQQSDARRSQIAGSKSIIGIASSEGADPSDAEYITAINDSFSAKLQGHVTYLYQDSEDSNPTVLNQALNDGAFWLTYIGHGSGFEWPSMNYFYSVNDIANLHNEDVVKPILIDVACQNGRLLSDHLGSQFMLSPNVNAGAVGYYGGTVNISWHPPAIMARGMAFEHVDKNFKYLGQALLAGQMYLAANWASPEDFIDNLEWYHLQGDPSYDISIK